MRRSRGFSLIETVVAVAIFALLLLSVAILDRELIRFDRTMRLEFLLHPEPASVLARLRRDVLDSRGYPAHYATWEQSPSTLLLDGNSDAGSPQVIVYDFTTAGTAMRMTFDTAGETSRWVANGTPEYRVSSFEMPDAGTAVRLQAFQSGVLILDEIMQPRAGN